MSKLKSALWGFAKGICLVALGLGSCVGLSVFLFPTYYVNTKVDRAQMDVRNLEAVVMAYKTRHDVFPKTLEELTIRDPIDDMPAPLVERELLDPWGNSYIYEPAQLHPKSGIPLIWTNGPPGENKPIRNWDLVNGQ